MDENHQDKVESKLIATEDKPLVPSLPPKDQEQLDHLRKKQGKKSNEWTGFSDKTLWDWLHLLLQILGVIAIPLAIIIGTMYFNAQQVGNNWALTVDQQREARLQTYLNRMSDLMLNHNLHNSQAGDEVSQVAREQTLTTLRNLDGYRNGIVLQFLRDAHLIGAQNAVIDLRGVNLSGASLDTTDLRGVNLSGANLYAAGLSSANLSGADLSGANLGNANLGNANLGNANLGNANLGGANLRGANLSGANLGFTNLNGATVTQAQLSTAASLTGAIMPDGTH